MYRSVNYKDVSSGTVRLAGTVSRLHGALGLAFMLLDVRRRPADQARGCFELVQYIQYDNGPVQYSPSGGLSDHAQIVHHD